VTGMFQVNKTDKYEVIELSTIERGVHLIPVFGPIGSTNSVAGVDRRGNQGAAWIGCI